MSIVNAKFIKGRLAVGADTFGDSQRHESGDKIIPRGLTPRDCDRIARC